MLILLKNRELCIVTRKIGDRKKKTQQMSTTVVNAFSTMSDMDQTIHECLLLLKISTFWRRDADFKQRTRGESG